MRQTGVWNAADGAEAFGLTRLAGVAWNFGAPALIERAVRRGEAHLSATGALAGESAAAPTVVLRVGDDGEGFNRARFDDLRADMADHAAGRELFAQDLRAGVGRAAVRLFSEHAWRALFAACSFEREDRERLAAFRAELVALDMPSFRPHRETYGLAGPFVAVDADRGVVLSGGGASAASLMRALADALAGAEAPRASGLSLNAAVAGGASIAVFVGASGTGKTSLAGDDALADGAIDWSAAGLAGVAAPVVEPSPIGFGAVMENASLDPETREPQDDGVLAAQLLAPSARPADVFILTRDAHGVLPPIARLDVDGAVRFMLLGYDSEPTASGPLASFDPGFGGAEDLAGFGETLAALVAQDGARCWLVNTGWVGPAGDDTRVPLQATRAAVLAARSGALDDTERRLSRMFGFEAPLAVPGVDPGLLNARAAFGNKRAFLAAARALKAEFDLAAERLGLSADAPGGDEPVPFREAAE